MKQLLIIGAVAAALLMACGDEGSKPSASPTEERTVLHLEGIDISPGDYAQYILHEIIEGPFGKASCMVVQDHSVDELLARAIDAGDHSPGDLTTLKVYGGVLKYGQQVGLEEERVSLEIMRDECKKANS